MPANPLQQLRGQGQSVWLDYLSRDLIASGELARRVDRDAIGGVTSNPTIFHTAISGSATYDREIQQLGGAGYAPAAIFEALAVEDIRAACDVLRSLYDGSDGADGFVSLEVSPHLANDTDETVAEARRLRADVDRPNVMIKVPGTPEGLPAVEQLLGEGVNINITLIFAQAVYRAVAETYIGALEARAARGESLSDVASVASTFVSRIDTEVDARIESLIEQDPDNASQLRLLLGKAAIANSKAVYRIFQEIFAGDRFARLAARGARVQRPLWASTSTKNPEYPLTLYVDELIGPETVNTMPESTMDDFRAHGEVQETVTSDLEYWEEILGRIGAAGIDLDAVMQQLELEGVQKFKDSYDELMADLTAKTERLAT